MYIGNSPNLIESSNFLNTAFDHWEFVNSPRNTKIQKYNLLFEPPSLMNAPSKIILKRIIKLKHDYWATWDSI